MAAQQIAIPTGPVFGQLSLEWLGPTGHVRSHQWPARKWQSCAMAMEIGHRTVEHNKLGGTYQVSLEIIHEEAPDGAE